MKQRTWLLLGWRWGEGVHSAEVAFLLLTRWPWVWFSAFPIIYFMLLRFINDPVLRIVEGGLIMSIKPVLYFLAHTSNKEYVWAGLVSQADGQLHSRRYRLWACLPATETVAIAVTRCSSRSLGYLLGPNGVRQMGVRGQETQPGEEKREGRGAQVHVSVPQSLSSSKVNSPSLYTDYIALRRSDAALWAIVRDLQLGNNVASKATAI